MDDGGSDILPLLLLSGNNGIFGTGGILGTGTTTGIDNNILTLLLLTDGL